MSSFTWGAACAEGVYGGRLQCFADAYNTAYGAPPSDDTLITPADVAAVGGRELLNLALFTLRITDPKPAVEFAWRAANRWVHLAPPPIAAALGVVRRWLCGEVVTAAALLDARDVALVEMTWAASWVSAAVERVVEAALAVVDVERPAWTAARAVAVAAVNSTNNEAENSEALANEHNNQRRDLQEIYGRRCPLIGDVNDKI